MVSGGIGTKDMPTTSEARRTRIGEADSALSPKAKREATIGSDVVAIPDGVAVQVSGKKVTAKGPKGTVEREFKVKGLVLRLEGKGVAVGKEEGSPLGSDMLNTVSAHIRNICLGAKEGYTKRMQVIYSHFPIALEVKGSVLVVKNFLGEKRNREARIIGSTKVEAKGQNVTITGPSKEDVGQTVANIKTATKIKRRDSRVFQDGLYMVE